MFKFIHFPRLQELGAGFAHLLYPDLCAGCQRDLPLADSCFCMRCLPKLTAFELENLAENEITNRLWGRVPVAWGAAAYHFIRRSPIQKAMHRLKYQNQPDIALKIGRSLGKKLITRPEAERLDAIIPVPLHPKKERLRGYNQSAVFARGISEVTGVPVFREVLRRKQFTDTQTRKKRMERFHNVQEVFGLQQGERLAGKHLLLVDDVLTTGATLELCALELLKIPEVRIGVAVIAVADL